MSFEKCLKEQLGAINFSAIEKNVVTQIELIIEDVFGSDVGQARKAAQQIFNKVIKDLLTKLVW